MPSSTINPYALGWVSDFPSLLLCHSIVFVLFLAGCRLLADRLHPLARSVGLLGILHSRCDLVPFARLSARLSVLLGVISFLLSWRRPLRAAEWTLLAILGHIQFFYFALYLVGIPRWIDLGESEHRVQALVTALLIAAPGIGLASYRWRCLDATLLFAWSHALRILLAIGFAICLTLPSLSLPQQLSIVTA